MARNLAKKIDGTWYFVNPKKVNKTKRTAKKRIVRKNKSKGGLTTMAKKRRSYRPRSRNYRIRHRISRPRRRLFLSNPIRRTYRKRTYKRRNPIRRSYRRRNPDLRTFGKKVTGVSVGALIPIVLSSILPINYPNKVHNFARDMVYTLIGWGISRVSKKTKKYSKWIAIGGVSGAVVNYTKDQILELGFLQGLRAAKALPEAKAEGSRTSFYYDIGTSPMSNFEGELAMKGLPPFLQ